MGAGEKNRKRRKELVEKRKKTKCCNSLLIIVFVWIFFSSASGRITDCLKKKKGNVFTHIIVKSTEWEKLGLALVGRALINKALIQLSAYGWGFPPSVSCLAWGNPALGPMVGLMANSKRNYFTGHLPGLLLPVPPSPQQATAEPHLYRRPSNTSR